MAHPVHNKLKIPDLIIPKVFDTNRNLTPLLLFTRINKKRKIKNTFQQSFTQTNLFLKDSVMSKDFF